MTSDDTHSERPHDSFARRILGVLRLAAATFADIERDPRALVQAACLVIAAGAARGVGAFADEGITGLIGSAAVGLTTWLVAGGVIWAIGVKCFAARATLAEVMRSIGFATAPLLLLALGALPLGAAHDWLWAVTHVWATLAMTIATREALGLDTRRALAVCVLALAAGFAALALMGMLVSKWGAFD
jgi:hypothetical protein